MMFGTLFSNEYIYFFDVASIYLILYQKYNSRMVTEKKRKYSAINK